MEPAKPDSPAPHEVEELPLEPPEQVLSTLNPDGTRRWLAPRLAKGRFWKRRRVVAYALILLFNVLPWIRIGGKPAVLFDVAQREFTVFGTTFQPTETLLVTLLILVVFVSIFLATALFGRVWCGWGCPQTVYLEFLYRPLERLAEGRYHSKGRAAVPGPRKVLKYALFVLVSVHLSHTFLAYFVGGTTVLEWSTGSPAEHPVGFLIVWGTAAAMMVDFAFFREQMCILACPYGRLQSALLDPNSVVIGYDPVRGEPRGKGKRGPKAPAKNAHLGDCVDCKLCVAVCPTGIDIRDGLQMECVNCAECVDACDSVMDKVGLPRGLIRYASENELAGEPRKNVRPRTVAYGGLLAAALIALGLLLGGREAVQVTTLRATGAPYTVLEQGALIQNQVRLRVENRRDTERRFTVELGDASIVTLPPELRFTLAPLDTHLLTFFVRQPPEAFTAGRRTLDLVLVADDGTRTPHSVGLSGPRP